MANKKAGKYVITSREAAVFAGEGGSISGNLTGITNIALTGTLSDGNYTFDTSGNASGLGTVAGGAITSTGQFKSGYTLQDPAAAGATPGNIAAGVLAVNTYYQSIAAATAMTIPAAATGNIGDFIVVYYNTAIGNGNAHTYTTTTDTAYTLGSTAVRVGGTSASKGDLSVAADNILTITGHTNGDGGVGTIVRFTNVTGAAQGWSVEAVTTNQGTGAQAGTIAFS